MKTNKAATVIIGGFHKNGFRHGDNKWRRGMSLDYEQATQTHRRTFNSKADQRRLGFSK